MALFEQIRGRRKWSSHDDMPPEWRALMERIKKRVEQELEPIHRPYQDRWDDLNALYFNYDLLKSDWQNARATDDTAARGVLLDAHRDWGGHLVIPYAFATVETVVPRVISNRPRFVAKALAPEAEERKGVIQDAVNQQMSDMDLELRLQPVGRRAVQLGLGVQFSYWKETTRKVRRWGTDELGNRIPIEAEVMDYRGPYLEDVDIYDWLWDPTAKSVETLDDVCYRTWRPFSYVREKVESGEWAPLDLDAVKNMGRGEKRHDLWQRRLEAQGLDTANTQNQEGHVHEVWHYFKADRVTTILDRIFVVQDDVTPFFHREFPFQVYRPTPIPGQLAGLGVVDSIRQLIAELSTMRTQRRDAATYRLNPPTFFQKGMIERRNMKTGPGVWIPVNGDIRDAVFQPVMGDIPASGYAEEDRLKADIEMTSGVSDPIAGGGGGNTPGTETATGIQLIQAAANVRIAQMARLLLLETLKPLGRQILEQNRQHQIEPEEIRVDDDSPAGYRFETVTPEDWMLPLELVPEEHSNEPENRPQKIDEAIRFYQLVQNNPNVNQREALKHVVEAFGIAAPEKWLQEQTMLDPRMAEIVGKSVYGTLIGAGMDEEQAGTLATQALDAAMQQTGVTAPSENGAVPEEVPSG